MRKSILLGFCALFFLYATTVSAETRHETARLEVIHGNDPAAPLNVARATILIPPDFGRDTEFYVRAECFGGFTGYRTFELTVRYRITDLDGNVFESQEKTATLTCLPNRHAKVDLTSLFGYELGSLKDGDAVEFLVWPPAGKASEFQWIGAAMRYEARPQGDMNGDGLLNAADLQLLVNAVLFEPARADQ